ncbi:MAG: metallopeptidase TldD-related protein [Patulibacter minatonensis]
MAVDLESVARRAAEFGGEEAVASVSLRRALVVECGPDGALRPPRRTDELLVRVLVRDGGGRLGVAVGGGVDDASLALLAERARAQAVGGHLDLRALPDPESGVEHEGFDEATAALDPAQASATARAAAASIQFALGRGRSATWRGEHVELAVARSGGGLVRDRRTAAQLCARATDDDGLLTGYAESAASAGGFLDAVALGASASPALAPIERHRRPLVLRGDDHAVVVEPAALAPLLEAFARTTCTGRAHATGTSPYTGRLGSYVAPPWITLLDSPRYLHTLGRAIDVEGAPAQMVPLIEGGVAAGVLHDVASAAEAGVGSTGHATDLSGAPLGPIARNLVLRESAEPVTALELAGRSEVPVVVVAVLDEVVTAGPVSTRFRALGRGARLVDGGAVVALLGDVVVTGDLAGLFEDVEELGGRPQLVARLRRLPEHTTATWCPAVRGRGLDVVVA